MKTTVFQAQGRCDQVGQRLPASLHQTSEQISEGLAKRLYLYAEDRFTEAGFTLTVGWEFEVYTLNASDKPADRAYTVRAQNDKGGYLEVIGILTNKGCPILDHGFAVGQE